MACTHRSCSEVCPVWHALHGGRPVRRLGRAEPVPERGHPDEGHADRPALHRRRRARRARRVARLADHAVLAGQDLDPPERARVVVDAQALRVALGVQGDEHAGRRRVLRRRLREVQPGRHAVGGVAQVHGDRPGVRVDVDRRLQLDPLGDLGERVELRLRDDAPGQIGRAHV